MASISLRNREIDGDLDENMRKMLEEFGVLEDDAKEIAVKMLAHSRPFVDFIEHVRTQDGEGRPQTRLIDVGEKFQTQFRNTVAPTHGISWTEALSLNQPDILRNTIGRDLSLTDRNVKAGWHSVLTPKGAGNGSLIIGAKMSQYHSVQDQGKVLENTFPEHLDGYRNIRHSSSHLESDLGLRSGRIHFFLADDALKNVLGVAPHKSYLEAEPNELIVFTMHARFFFVCLAKDLSDWLKSAGAREAFGEDRLRMQGHKYPATEADIQRVNPMRDFSIESFLQSKGGDLQRIPANNLGGAYLGAMDRALQTRAPHLKWNTLMPVSRDSAKA